MIELVSPAIFRGEYYLQLGLGASSRNVILHMDVRLSIIVVKIPSQNTALPWNFHNQEAGSHFHVEKTLGVCVLLQRNIGDLVWVLLN